MYRLLLLCLLLSTSLHTFSQKLLKNIAASDESANINESLEDLSNYLIKGDTLFFLAQDTTFDNYHYKNIWFTNGTTAHTKKVTNDPGTLYLTRSYTLLASFKGKAYFRDYLARNLYSTDGNTISLVKTFDNSVFLKAGVLNGWLYLFVNNYDDDILELWKTDGTSENTTKVTDIYNGSHDFSSNNFFNSGDKLYFNVWTSVTGYELWMTDGTAVGTKILKDIVTGSKSGNPNTFEKVGNTIFFNANGENFYQKLWKTDGTEAGTVMVADAIDGNTLYAPRALVSLNNELYFRANDHILYKTNGTTITSIKPDAAIYGNMVRLNNRFYFIRLNGSDFELWKSDGTSDGTEIVKTIFSTEEYFRMEVKILAGVSKIYFQLSIFSNGKFENITQHWVSDGTTAGTVNINTLNPDFSTGSLNNQLALVGDTYYFTAYDATNGFELWKTNGTSIGTVMVKNINKTVSSSEPAQFVGLGNDVFFSADDIKYGREIWKTDGTTANTQLLMDYNATSSLSINYSADIKEMIAYNDVIIAQISYNLVKFSSTLPPTPYYDFNLTNVKNPEFIRFNNKIYFKGYDNYYNGGSGGYELFVTDGNTASKVKDFSTDYEGGNPSNFLVLGGLLYFTTENNSKIWKSDGTEAGTVLVKDLTEGTISSKFYAANGLLLFLYDSPTYGLELWKSDGTDAGTALVKDINPGVMGAYIRNLTVYNNYLYFTAYNGSTDYFYKSDGSNANTQVFSNVVSSNVPVILKNKLFFIAYDNSSTTYWLWSTDGVSAPVKVQQVANTLQDANAIIMKNINDKLLVFDITPTTAKHELWTSDGTVAGTYLVKVIRQKELSKTYMNITEYFYNNNKLYFAADDGINGKELWMWDLNCPEFMTIASPITEETDVRVEKYIVGSNKINASVRASYNASKYITLNPGFETQQGAKFTATMNGCINVGSSSVSTTNSPIFQHTPTKELYKPSTFQFLNEPSNMELQTAYLAEQNNQNEKNIIWIFTESPTQYILKMRVGEKEFIGYLPK
jgi:ELWxxDGT repeat protein